MIINQDYPKKSKANVWEIETNKKYSGKLYKFDFEFSHRITYTEYYNKTDDWDWYSTDLFKKMPYGISTGNVIKITTNKCLFAIELYITFLEKKLFCHPDYLEQII